MGVYLLIFMLLYLTQPIDPPCLTCVYQYDHDSAILKDPHRLKFLGTRVSYYSNSTATVQLDILVSGDVCPNPGPNDLINSKHTDVSSVLYSRELLLSMNRPSWSISTPLLNQIKYLGIQPPCRTHKIQPTRRTHRGTRGGCRKTRKQLRSTGDEVLTPAPNPNKLSIGASLGNKTDLLCDMVPETNCDINQNLGPTALDSEFDNLFHPFRRSGLNFIHLNTRSLKPKISELKLLANNTKAAAICISETWLDSSISDAEIMLDGYSVLRNDRNRQGGGVCLYIRTDIAYNPRTDIVHPDIRSVWCDLLLPKSKPILIGAVYNPHRESNFRVKLEDFLNDFDISQETYILGDTNICTGTDSCNHKKSTITKAYLNVLSGAGFHQLIDKPTRVTETSISCIDHIICNFTNKVAQSGVIPFGVSDHSMIYCTRKQIKIKFNKHKTVSMRSMKHYSANILCNYLDNCDWSLVLNSNCVNTAWSNFTQIFNTVLNKIAPYRVIRIKQSTEPWMTSSILDLIRTRDHMRYCLDRGFPNASFREFTAIRNKVQREIKKARASYFKTKLEDSQGDPRKLWQHLKQLGYSSKSPENAKIVLNINGELCHFTRSICNYINTFFATIAHSLVSKLPSVAGVSGTVPESFVEFYRMKDVTPNGCVLQPVSEDFIFKELSGLNKNKGPGLDGIAPRFLKDGAKQLAPLITHIVNLSISSSTVPDDMKSAKVIPLFKKKSRLEVGNYRPVSILSCVSKILEKSVYKQIENYLSSTGLLFKFQSGFRAGYSTESCLAYLTDYIRKEISEGKFVGMLLLDVQKAFDSVNHQILCNKLEAMGIDPSWFKSYLANRQQLVSIDGINSSLEPLSCGVPQGSLLGPLLYLCYSNDMVSSVHNLLLLYADDSVIISSHTDPAVISHSLSSDLKSCNDWLIANKLSLHVGKTECILFGTKIKLGKTGDFTISYNDQIIKSQDSIKYLGVTLDQCLSGDNMFNSIMSKVNGRLKFLYRHSQYFNQKLRKNLCSAIIQCHIDYCCTSWFSGLTSTKQKKLKTFQNKMVRFILNLPPREHIGQVHLNSIKILNIQDRVKQLRLNHVFNVFHASGPSYLQQFFSKVSNVHSHGTRSRSYNFHVPHHKSLAADTFYYNGIIDWNSLPYHVKSISDKHAFKAHVKTHLSQSSLNRELAEYA